MEVQVTNAVKRWPMESHSEKKFKEERKKLYQYQILALGTVFVISVFKPI